MWLWITTHLLKNIIFEKCCLNNVMHMCKSKLAFAHFSIDNIYYDWCWIKRISFFFTIFQNCRCNDHSSTWNISTNCEILSKYTAIKLRRHLNVDWAIASRNGKTELVDIPFHMKNFHTLANCSYVNREERELRIGKVWSRHFQVLNK